MCESEKKKKWCWSIKAVSIFTPNATPVINYVFMSYLPSKYFLAKNKRISTEYDYVSILRKI